MIRKVLFSLVIIILLVYVGNAVYNYNTFFFNSSTFEQDHITYLPPTAYKKKMGYTVSENSIQDDLETLFNDNLIRLIYTELKKGEVLGNNIDSPSLSLEPKGYISIYSDADNKKEKSIVSRIMWYGEDSKYVKVSGEFKVKGEAISGYLFVGMTPTLQKTLSEVFN